ncbi:MAG TPA: alpha/beta hydrolase [Candidatus Binataceae bacterium]|nr:alpha/beta hydrolase [Candidatus Binataceae bacterium]
MRVQVGDGRLFFDVEGAKLVTDGPKMRERPTLLLLHGGPGFDHSTFKPHLSPLAEVAQVIYLDHRSNGRSDRTPPDRWTLAHWADDVRAFCEALEIEKPIVMGTSFGGFVALSYGTRHPDHPGKLIFCTTSAKWRLPRVLDAFERIGGAQARAAAKNYWESPGSETMAAYIRDCFPLYNRNRRGNESITRSVMNTELMTEFPRTQQSNFDFLPDLRRIKCPTLVLGGEDDPITPIEDSEDIAAAIPKDLVRFERFPATGHGIVNDAPERFIEVLKDFVNG